MNETHPDHLLAEYVDGDLDHDAREHVEAHLAECSRCREEVRLAADARGSLGALPRLEAPDGIALEVRRRARRTIRVGGWRRAAGPVAVAAALVGGAAIVVSNLDLARDTGAGQGGAPAAAPSPRSERREGADETTAEDSAGEAPFDAALRRAAPAPRYEETARTYDPADLSGLGRRFRDEARALLSAGLAPTATAFFDEFDAGEVGAPTRRAVRCVLAEVPPNQLVVPFAIEGAVFEDRQAYVAAFLQGPAPDRRYDRVVIWVVDREACSLLSLATQRL